MIRTRLDYEEAIRNLARLLGPFQTSDEGAKVEQLAGEIEQYERQFGISFQTPSDAIRYRMRQMGLSIENMAPYLGTPAVARQVLNGSMPLTLKMIESLISRLGLSADILIQPIRKAA